MKSREKQASSGETPHHLRAAEKVKWRYSFTALPSRNFTARSGLQPTFNRRDQLIAVNDPETLISEFALPVEDQRRGQRARPFLVDDIHDLLRIVRIKHVILEFRAL